MQIYYLISEQSIFPQNVFIFLEYTIFQNYCDNVHKRKVKILIYRKTNKDLIKKIQVMYFPKAELKSVFV